MFLAHLIRYLYSLLWLVVLPFVLIRLLWKGRLNPDYKKCVMQRFGFFSVRNKWKNNHSEKKYWIHAVSVGEVNVAMPLVLELIKKEPQSLFLITTMTPTGKAQLLREAEKEGLQGIVEHSFIPYDVPFFITNLLRKVSVKKLIVIETELWPNLYHVVNKRNIEIYIANMRLSDNSSKNYIKIKQLLQPMISSVSKFLVQTESDAMRVKSLGALAEKVIVVGNVKYDIAVSHNLKGQSDILKKYLGDRPIWTAGSTHRGEEEILIDVHEQWLQQTTNGLLIIVPRHPERFDDVEKQLIEKKLNYICFSEIKKVINQSSPIRDDLQKDINGAKVILGNTMGDLMTLYSISDIAFVAGSLVAVGGHNIIEPILLNKATVHGPYMHNFRKIAEDFKTVNACFSISSAEEMLDLLNKWQNNTLDTKTVIENGQKVLHDNKGATLRCVIEILA